MIELSVSGKSEGPVASSNIDLFLIRDGSITELLSTRLRDSRQIEEPFEILSIFVLAKPHNAPAKPAAKASGIGIRAHKNLMRFQTGQLMKSFDLILSNDNFYRLSSSDKRRAIVAAFEAIATRIAEEFAGPAGAALSAEILLAATDYLAERAAGDARRTVPCCGAD